MLRVYDRSPAPEREMSRSEFRQNNLRFTTADCRNASAQRPVANPFQSKLSTIGSGLGYWWYWSCQP